jgi:Immunity protein 26
MRSSGEIREHWPNRRRWLLTARMTAVGDPNLRILKPSRPKLQPGDVFTFSPAPERFLFGRVILADLPKRRAPMPTANLIYIYSVERPTPTPLPMGAKAAGPASSRAHARAMGARETGLRQSGSDPAATDQRSRRRRRGRDLARQTSAASSLSLRSPTRAAACRGGDRARLDGGAVSPSRVPHSAAE